MKKNNIMLALFCYIVILSIFKIFPFLDFNSIATSIIRGLSFLFVCIYTVVNSKFNKKTSNKLVCLFALLYIVFQAIVFLFNNSITELSKELLMCTLYPGVSFLLFVAIGNNIKVGQKDLIIFNKCVSLYVLFSCFYNIIANFNQIGKIIDLKSPYDLNFTSFFDNRNIFGLLLIFGFLSTFTIVLIDKKRKNIFWKFSMAIILINLFFTLSRSCILFVSLFLILYLVFDNETRKKVLNKKYIIISLATLIIIAIIPYTRNFILNNVIRISSGVTHRDEVLKYGLKYFTSNNWLIGNGYINPYIEYAKHFSYIGFHNTYLTILICQGIIGLMFFLLVLSYSIFNSVKLRQKNKKIGSACLATIICYIVYSFFESRLLFYPEYLDLIVTIFVVLVPLYVLNSFKKKTIQLNNDALLNKSDNELISVIIPVYNVKKYLSKGIDSILNQTYKNLQILLIDDGSTDGSEKICDEYKKKDKRIEVIHKKNGGVSSARNAGLKEAKGTYIYFMDSDDYVENDLIEKLYGLLISSNADSVCVNYYKVDENGVILNEKEYTNEMTTLNKKEVYKIVIESSSFSGFLWNKLYKNSLVKGIYFNDKIHYREDLLFNCKYFQKANKIVYFDHPYCYYLQREGSVLNTKKFNKKMLSHIDVMEELINIYNIECPEKTIELKYEILKICYNLKYRMKISNLDDEDYNKKIDITIKKYYDSTIKNEKLTKTRKIELKITGKYPILIGYLKQIFLEFMR